MLTEEDELLRSRLLDARQRLDELNERLAGGDKRVFKALKLARKEYNSLLAELKKRLRRARDDLRRDCLDELLREVEG